MCWSKLKKADPFPMIDYDFDFDPSWDQCDYVSEQTFNNSTTAGKDLSIVHWNVRGLSSKSDEINLLMQNLKPDTIDVVSLNETWLTKSTNNLPIIPGYDLISKPRLNKKGGGVGFLVNSKIPHRRHNDLELASVILEHAVLELKCKSKVLLCGMYRPPNSDIALFLDEYKQVVNKLKGDKHGNIVICLDHNLDFLKHDKHAPTRQFIESNLDFNLLPIITRPTRVTHNSATLIDNIIISEKLQIKYKSGIMINDASDHLPCYLTLPDETDHEVKKFNLKHVQKFSTKTRAAIVRDLNETAWVRILENLSTNDSFECFHRHLLQILDKHAPIKTIKIKNKHNSLPWLSNNIKRCINKNKELYTISLASKSDKSAYTVYKEYNKVLTKVKRAAKISYFKNKCIELKGNGAKLWNLINNTVKKTTNKKQVIDKLKVENIELLKSEEIANEFAKYYSTIGTKLMNRVNPLEISINSYINKIKNNKKTLYLRPTTSVELEKIIMNLKNKTSTGFDEISNIMLKWLCPSIVFPLSIVFNKSLEEGVFPDLMKLSDVIPLYKNKERFLCNSYCPISLLLTISKILEKVIYKRVYNFLQETRQITNNQFGFRSSHSCTDAIINLCSEIIKNNERGIHTLGVFLDLSKAFDTLSHNILLMKLEKYGLRGVTLDWFSSYLLGRKLRSKVAVSPGSTSTYSDYYEVNIGTPQGSCLGPLLFLLYINDLNLNLEYFLQMIPQFSWDTEISLI